MRERWYPLLETGDEFLVDAMPGGSRFTWTIDLEPNPKLRPLLRLANPINAQMIHRIAQGMRSQVV